MTPPARAPRRELHGVLLLDKPVGWSSNDALQKVKGMLRATKAGHTGTLDPLASGLLPLCFGAATKFSQAALDADKRYRATLHLGQTRVGGDREGAVIDEQPVVCTDEELAATLRRFVGPQRQRPPMHSALKHQGRALYEYAREGIEVDRAEREVHIHALELVQWERPLLTLDVHCSKGTYVRTLAEDIGRALGCGAHLAGLRRTGSGALDIAQAISLDELQALPEAERERRLLGADVLLSAHPSITLDDGEAARFLTGLRRRVSAGDQPRVRVYGPPASATLDRPAFLGAAHITAGELIPDRLLSPHEVRAMPA